MLCCCGRRHGKVSEIGRVLEGARPGSGHTAPLPWRAPFAFTLHALTVFVVVCVCVPT